MATIAWSAGMAWWLSSSVCGFTVISKLYSDKEVLIKQGLYKPLGYLVSFIFLAMILFGSIVFYDLGKIESSLYKTFINSCETFKIPDIEPIFALVKKLYLLSTSTLVTFLLIWLYIWFYKPITDDNIKP
ncbi:MAG: hypothetical protein M0P69_12115 [Bacteroidales bacterium]|nr:hypothetical protein [Bacteroidales bacterium]